MAKNYVKLGAKRAIGAYAATTLAGFLSGITDAAGLALFGVLASLLYASLLTGGEYGLDWFLDSFK